jgi:hypothetical protein
MRRIGFLVASLFLVSGCSGKLTFKGICERIAEAGCDKRAECDPPAPDNCEQTAVNACCAVFEDCEAEVEGEGIEDELDQCVDDYQDLSCTAFEQGEIPQSCE